MVGKRRWGGWEFVPPTKQTSVRFGDFGLFERITFKLGMLLYFDPRTYKGGEGGGGVVAATPLRFSRFVPDLIKHQHLSYP